MHNPAEQHTLRSISGKFSGLHVLCNEYLGFRIIELAAEYAAALAMFGR